MPIAITGLGPAGSSPAPAVSALVELGSALHVLHDPTHHGADRWAADVRAALSDRLAERTRAWSWTTQAIRAAPFVTVSAPVEDFRHRLDRLRDLPAGRLAGQLLRPISPSGDARAALRWSRSRGPGVATLVEALIERPAEAVADFLSFLEDTWREWFADEWRRVRPSLAARARRLRDAVAAHGTVRALTSLDPSVRPTADGDGVTVAKVRNARHDVTRRGLLVASSPRIRPHLYLADVPGSPLLLIHPTDPGGPVPAVADQLRRLMAVAHPGRLEVARAIATEARTAGEIARLWNMDPTLVNRHLRALAAARLARATRRGRFVSYRLDAAAVDALGTDLTALLLR
jgi:hypothetical protein